ncbi:serine hydroxymethyltransferase [Erythrobacter donghaensis]|uniref:serine hydroxymethyltransferase n=1 Tax=Erythrobacter donghaensis TaxID=267135 RepID=UPI003CCC3910
MSTAPLDFAARTQNQSGAAQMDGFWNDDLAHADPEIAAAIGKELARQRDKIELIASENIASRAVLEAAGSVFTNKYAEGYPGKRYYGGCDYADVVETLAIERAKQLFGCNFANVQPNSGSQMNQAVFLALLNPGDTFMGLDLNSGGHLTHGSPVNMSGKWFNVVSYGVARETETIDMDEVAAKARESKPKIIICGGTAYSRTWDFPAFRAIADEVGAVLLCDMSHISGLVAGGAHPSPFPHCDIVTSTTHKSLRGPRSGIILWNDEKYTKPLNMAVFPGLQGGPLMHIVAAKAVAFKEALDPSFSDYAHRIVENARALAASLEENGLRIVSGGTDNHSMLVDLTAKDVTGKDAEKGLDRAFLTCNKNGIPYDTRSPFVTSGIRLGTPAGTTRGFGPDEFRTIGKLIAEVVEGLSKNGPEGDAQIEESVRQRVSAMCAAFPVYPGM